MWSGEQCFRGIYCLCFQEMGVVCLSRTLTVPEDWVSVWKYTILVLFGLKWYYEGGWGLAWHSSFGSMVSHTTFYRNKALLWSLTQLQFCIYCPFWEHGWPSMRNYMHYVTTPPTYIFSDEKPEDGQWRPKHVAFIIL